jgi:hypothetical protein
VEGEWTVLWFTADCIPPGGVRVTATTTGAGAYPDGMLVWVEEAARLRDPYYGYDEETDEYVPATYLGEQLASNGFATVDLSAGTHVVELRGVPPHCKVGGGAKQSVTVQEDVLTYLDLLIRCD